MAFVKKIGLVALLALAPALAAGGEGGFLVVAHPSVKLESVSRDQLSRLFLKKETRWPDGAGVLVVEPADPAVRKAFATGVHGKSLGALRSYWNQMIFSGRDVPPVEKPSDEAVLDYVRQHPGAIGYASAGAVPSGVRSLPVK